MNSINVHEAKTNLSKILVQVEGGQEFLIARAGKVIARLTGPFYGTVKTAG